jgi:hypothetical protein
MKKIINILIFTAALAAYVTDVSAQTEIVTHETKAMSMGQRGTLKVNEIIIPDTSGFYVFFILRDTKYSATNEFIPFPMNMGQVHELHSILKEVVAPENKSKTILWKMNFLDNPGTIYKSGRMIKFSIESDVGSFSGNLMEAKIMLKFIETQALKYF